MRPLFRRTAATVAGIALLAGASACTGEPEPEPEAKPSSSATPSPTPVARPSVPWKVAVTRVAGRLPAKDRPALEANVRKALSVYLDRAFLAGDYPRADFRPVLGVFTSGVARSARRDQALLTNAALGPTTESVRAARRTAYLSVLAPNDVAAGITANVDLVFVVDRGERPSQRLALTGRLLLTRDRTNGWAIFGYDLNRSVTPIRRAS